MFKIFPNLWKSDSPRAHVLGFYEAMKPIHDALTKQWYANLAMQRGGAGQWMEYAENSNILTLPAVPTWRQRPSLNKILPLSIIQRHKLLPDNPTISVRPANQASDIDKLDSETAQRLARATWDEEEFQDELEEMTLWMVPCTMGYLLTLWDDKAGKEIAPGVYTGEQIFDAPGPFEIIPDYSESRFKNVGRFLRVKVRSLDYIFQKYGKKVKPQKIDMGTLMQVRALALAIGKTLDLQKILEDHALVMDMFELPTTKYPEGFHHVCTEDADLQPQRNLDPYYVLDQGKKKYFLPWDWAQMVRLAGALVGTNSVEQATSAQKYYNRGKGLVLENQARLGRTKIFAPANKIPKGAMVEDPAEIIVEYDETIEGEIVPFKPPEMPQFIIENTNRLPAEVQDAFGIHDATTGVLPRRATSGKAIGFLVDMDDERHFDPKSEIDRAIGGAFTKALNIRANGYTEERIKELIGEDGKATKLFLKPDQLRNFDVRITRDTALPKNAADRMDIALEILGKKATKEQMEIVFAIMKARNVDDLEAIIRGSSQAEEMYARIENYDLVKGFWRPPQNGENHVMHAKIHEEALRNPNTPPDAKALINQHIQIHHTMAGEEAAAGQLPPTGEGPLVEQPPAIPPALPPAMPGPNGFAGPGAAPGNVVPPM